MIDFELTPADKNVLAAAHEQALIGRRYARVLRQARRRASAGEISRGEDIPSMVRVAEEGVSGSSGARILHSLVMLESSWGGHGAPSQQMGTRQHRARNGCHSGANREVEELHDLDRDHRTERRIGSREHQNHRDLRSRDRRMDPERRENLHLAGRNLPMPRWCFRASSRRMERAA